MIPVQSESEEEVVQTVKAVKKKKKLVKKAEIEQEIPILQEKVKPKRAGLSLSSHCLVCSL